MSENGKQEEYFNICMGCIEDKGYDSVCKYCGYDEKKSTMITLFILSRDEQL